MTDPRLVKMADTLVSYSVRVQPGDIVVINTQPAATPLVLELYRAILQAGGNPVTNITLPNTRRTLLKYASAEQLSWVTPFDRWTIEQANVRMNIDASTNTRELAQVPSDRMALMQAARRDLMKTFMQRSATGDLRWNVALFPTEALAQDANMSLHDYEDFVFNACFLNADDPIAEWRQLHTKHERLMQWLDGKREVHIVGPDTDLTVGIAGRSFVNCAGDANFPDGEIFTGPEETRVNGTVRFSFPAIFGGRQVEDVRLTFKDGVVVKATAQTGQDYLEQMLNMDEGARRLGEFAFGTNPNIQTFTRSILFDEKIGGTIHMALGAGYPETGSQNESALHWDMICDLRQGSEIFVDGELFAKDGAFTVL